ncbi:LPS-assembly protein LptD [Maricurvus nonylphenolicus]|uniref:LPS-assembly protein LptD n=1 Tax=Maricurvus nonylphenolicus TaxID=1008307 RepID=UPI0036F333BA
MDHRNSLLKQHIRQALRPSRSSLLLAVGLLAAQPITPLQAADTHPEWSCHPAADGKGWSCQEMQAPGPVYQRPQHATRHTKVTNNAVAGAAAAVPARGLKAANVDWVPVERMTPEQRAAMNPVCCGDYIEPERTDAEADMNPNDAPLRATADSSEVLQETTAVLTGNVKLTQGYRQLEADKATLDQATDHAELEGNIRLREPGVLVTGTRAEMDMNSGHAVVEDASYLVHEAQARGDATKLENLPEKVVVLDNSTFTRCEPDSNTWFLQGSEIKLDSNTNQGTGKHVRVNIKGVPVFYTPYIRFPLGSERQSGFLFPSISSTDSDGFDIATPYYLNLAPNYDATITPRHISDRGAMLETEFRHLSESFETSVSMAFLGSDDGGGDDDDQIGKLDTDGNLITEDDVQRYKGEDRWLLNIDQIGGLDKRWNSRIDYTTVSDIDYFRDLDTASLEVNSATHLEKSAEFGYRFTNWNLTVKAEEFQTISENTETPYKQLPRINLDGNYRFGDWVVEMENEYVDFDHRDDFWRDGSSPRITGERAFLDYSLSWDKRWIWGFVKPTATVKSLHYNLDSDGLNAGAEDSVSITVPQGSLDMGLFFEREGSLFGNGYVQTFEPRLFYFYSDYESHDELFDVTNGSGSRADVDFDTSELTFSYSQLFRDSRFSGNDRIGDDNRLSVGLTTRFIETSTGIERFSASLGQIYYYDDRAVDLTLTSEQALLNADNTANDSEIAAQLAARIGDHWTLSTDLAWDEDENDKVSRGSSSLRYMDDDYRIFNLTYRFSRRAGKVDTNDIDGDGDTSELINNDVDQADLSFIWPIAGGWSLVGRGYHDFTFQRELESMAGVEYNSCCYRMRVVARRWLDNDLANVIDDEELEYDKGIFFEFQLKGLGGIGSTVSGILSDGIYGYDRREENQK